MKEKTIITGTYHNTINKNFNNGFTLFSFYCKNYEEFKVNGTITCKGYVPVITKGVPLKLTGYFEKNFVGTNVFVVENAELYSDNFNNTFDYLTSDRFKGIGPKTAEKIIEIAGENIFSFIKSPDAKSKLSAIPELKKNNKLNNLIDTINNTFFEKEVYDYIKLFGGSYSDSEILFETYKTDAIAKIQENPYEIGRELSIPFIVCDSIARENNFYYFHKSRIAYLVINALYSIASNGHTIANLDNIYKNVVFLVKQSAFPEYIPPYTLISCTLHHLNSIITDFDENEERVYSLKEFATAEKVVVNNLLKIRNKKIKYNVDIEEQIKITENKFKIKYAEKQKSAFYFLKSSGFKILTGGPGTGKTTVINGLIDTYKRIHGSNKSIILCAPTGRASQKIKEATGYPAHTIHRILNIKPYTTEKDNYYETEELNADLIIIDEFSMVDIKLFAYITNAIKDDATVILCGDTFQLPSVGAGNVLNDLISSEMFELEHLDVIYRQKENSSIIKFAQDIKNGNIENFLSQSKSKTVLVADKEIPICHVYKDKSLQLIQTSSCDNIHEIIINSLKKSFLNKDSKFYVDNILDLQVLSPIKKENAGTNSLNKDIHSIYHKDNENLNKSFFNIGDKIMMMENNYEIGYCNGDIGFVKEIDLSKNSIIVEINSEIINIPHSSIKDVSLCYACTIHKSQGSEYDYVIISLPAEPKSILQRNLIYTAITRAKKYVAVVYENNSLKETVFRNNILKRRTNLKKSLLKALTSQTH